MVDPNPVVWPERARDVGITSTLSCIEAETLLREGSRGLGSRGLMMAASIDFSLGVSVMYVLILKRKISLAQWDDTVFLFTQGEEQSEEDCRKMVERWMLRYEKDHGRLGSNTLGVEHRWLDLGIQQPEW